MCSRWKSLSKSASKLGPIVERCEDAYSRKTKLDPSALGVMASAFANLRVVASTIRTIHSASRHDWGGARWADGEVTLGDAMFSLEILDRVGGGDSSAAAMIFGLLDAMPADEALRSGVAHGALAMSRAGGSSMASLDEVLRLVRGGSARMVR